MGWTQVCAPTFAVVSVRELRVVDLPDEGLPTRAMRGSRGMLTKWRRCGEGQLLLRCLWLHAMRSVGRWLLVGRDDLEN